ncbi:MAG TPA: hypothetical protein RMH99_08020 [Sandaracinaceae bacterium LLY-WYZ-13_1]|nr:hypothetical protein [Sandaracinaceae bacterium LLY-WYZ-13_1]
MDYGPLWVARSAQRAVAVGRRPGVGPHPGLVVGGFVGGGVLGAAAGGLLIGPLAALIVGVPTLAAVVVVGTRAALSWRGSRPLRAARRALVRAAGPWLAAARETLDGRLADDPAGHEVVERFLATNPMLTVPRRALLTDGLAGSRRVLSGTLAGRPTLLLVSAPFPRLGG